MHLSLLLSLITTALPLALVNAAPTPADDVASTKSYKDNGHCGGEGGGYGGSGKVDGWGRCGGKGYKGPTECHKGFYCKEWNEWYSQCVEKEKPYPPPPKTTSTTTTWAPYPTWVPGAGKCDAWKKCEYGLTCVQGFCKKEWKTTSSTTSYRTSTTTKTPYPTHKPQCWSDMQCPYSEVCYDGYCVKAPKTTTTSYKPEPTHEHGKCDEWKKCPYGEVCYNGYCVKAPKTTTASYKPEPTHEHGKCDEWKKCPYGEVCYNGYCVKAPKTTTTSCSSWTTSKGGYPTGYPSDLKH
ncbi:plectin [Rhodotorula toruloides]|uniref:Plectin n=1 Tax=Rhodotorula toruloides TaxID=5286 RepID=A0A511KCC0_RHOTO|nr:plectin [Rhodotorula toruloides]